jgi:hypothetical protein
MHDIDEAAIPDVSHPGLIAESVFANRDGQSIHHLDLSLITGKKPSYPVPELSENDNSIAGRGRLPKEKTCS